MRSGALATIVIPIIVLSSVACDNVTHIDNPANADPASRGVIEAPDTATAEARIGQLCPHGYSIIDDEATTSVNQKTVDGKPVGPPVIETHRVRYECTTR